jgi:hypothetical protein
MAKSKDSYVNRFDIRITIPEDELHPLSKDPLPHKVEIVMYRPGHNGEIREEIATLSFKEGNPELKKNFILRIAHLLVVMIQNTSFGKPLKMKYVKEMLERQEEVEQAFREKNKKED